MVQVVVRVQVGGEGADELQEARAREDPAMVCLDDAQVDARTHSEVVPGDDEPLHECVPLAPAASSDRSAPVAGSGRSARLTARARSRTRATTWREANFSASSRASRAWCS